MDTLTSLINLLDDGDLDSFSLFLRKRNTRADVKNIQMLDLLKTDDIKSVKKRFYTGDNTDAYHALRKRLQDNLLLFLSQRTFERTNNETYDALRLLVVSRFLLENERWKIARRCLRKAEDIARRLEQFNLMHEVLLLRLQFAHLHEDEDLDELTQEFLRNQEAMQREAKLNLAYAYLRRELQNVHVKGKVIDLAALIGQTIRTHRIAWRELMTYKTLYQILFIANEYAAIQQNYQLIASYVNKSYQFMERQIPTKSYHVFYELHIHYYLANFHLRSKAFATSAVHLAHMLRLMEDHPRYRTVFYLRHQLLLALNRHFSGEGQQAVWILKGALAAATRKSKTEDLDDVTLCLVMCLAQQGDAVCLRYLATFGHSDAWYEKKMGMLWTIRKTLMEVLIYTQFEDIDLAMSRLRTFKRRYKRYLRQTKEQRVLDFVSLIERFLMKPDVVHDRTFQERVLGMLTVVENTDIFNLSFIGWLISRWEKKTPYEVALRLMRHAHGPQEHTGEERPLSGGQSDKRTKRTSHLTK
ncbi:hypothetical protein [Sphingobacterium suaedae]|uniref:Uncharacterized protein n=1 Tax=Sphingobacterium suaedae TaxID=1686402 RepID=A0ABW5KDU1_9SPHI